MQIGRSFLALGLGLAALAGGCASTPEPPPELAQVPALFYSLDADPNVKVAVSPAGQTLRVAGLTGLVVGASVDAVANGRHRDDVRDALAGLEPAQYVGDRIDAGLKAHASGQVERVPPLGSTAGYKNLVEAERARFEGLGRQGAQLVLDVKSAQGLFGAQGTLAAELEADLYAVPSGRRVWHEDVLTVPEPILASGSVGDPTRRLKFNFSGPKFAAADDAVSQWTAGDGAALRDGLTAAIDGAANALMCAMGLSSDAEGLYHLGKSRLLLGDRTKAAEALHAAIAQAPDHADAKSTLAVLLAENGQVDDAISLARQVVEAHPGHGPTWYNLAWWLAFERQDQAGAQAAYARARALGMPANDEMDAATTTAS